MRWSRPGLRSRPAASRPRCSRRLTTLEGRQGPARSGRRSATARRSSSITRTSPMRWRRRSRRCGPTSSAGSSSCSAPAATAITGKRPLMGAIAAEKADRVIVTDDNPRSEDPAAIRAAILAAAPRRDRDRRPRRGDPQRGRRACSRATCCCRRQGPRNRPDRRRPDAAVQRPRRGRGGAAGEGRHERAALDRRGDGGGDGRGARGRAAGATCRAFRSTPARIAPGDAFFAIKGDSRDGHDFVEAALEGRRRARGRGRGQARRVAEGRAAARRAGRAGGAARAGARGARALAGEDHRASPARSARPAPRRRCGSRCRATARRMPRPPPTTITGACRCRSRAARRARAMRVFEIGMNHAGEIAPLTQAGAPACRDRHHDRAGASGILRLGRGDRRRQGGDLSRARAGRRRGHQPRQCRSSRGCRRARQGRRRRAHRLVRRARQAPMRGCRIRAAAGLLDRAGAHPRRTTSPTSSARRAAIVVHELARACWPRRRSPAPISRSRRWRSPSLQPPTGRGARITLDAAGRRGAADRRELQRQSGLDARGARAARPGADRAARPAHRGARRHAGTRAAGRRRCIAAWPTPIVDNAVDLVFCAGPLMQALWEALPAERRGGYAETSAALEAECSARSRAGDAVMVKGSLGSKMGPIVKALTAPASRRRRRAAAPRKVDPMLYWLADLSEHALDLQRLPLPHVPHRRRDDHGAGVRVHVRPVDHRPSARCARARASRSAPTARSRISSTKTRHADHGRADDPVGHRRRRRCCGPIRANPYVWIVLGVTLGFGLVGFYDDYLKVTKQTHRGFAGKLAAR